MPTLRRAAPWLAVVCLAAAPFLNGLQNGFVSDDQAQVTRNALVRSLDPGPILASGGVTHGRVEWYRPLTIYSFAVNWAAAGDRTLAYHLVNVGLHAANACLVLSIALALFGRYPPALIAAAAFAVHAVHTEAVTPVFGRADLLACLFVLLGWRLSLQRQRDDTWRATALSACLAAGLLAKESAIALIPVMLASDVFIDADPRVSWWRRAIGALERRPRQYAALAVTVAAYLVVRVAIVGGIQAGGSQIRAIENPLVVADTVQRVLTSLWVAVLYARLFLVPYPLRADYSYNQIPLIAGPGDLRLLAMLAILAALVAAVRWRREVRAGVPYLCIFALLLLPVSNLLFPIGTIMAERLMYLPSVGLCLLVGQALDPVLRRGTTWARTSIAVLAVAAAAHIAVAAARNTDWRSDEVLFARTVQASPRSAKARVNFAATLLDRGDAARAQPLLVEAIAIAPAYPEAHNQLGTIYLAQSDLERAAREFEAALRDAPDYAPALANMGIALRRMGRTEEALRFLERALSLDPSMAVAVVNLALLAEMKGDTARAAGLYSRAYALDPSLEIARARAHELSSRESPRQ